MQPDTRRRLFLRAFVRELALSWRHLIILLAGAALIGRYVPSGVLTIASVTVWVWFVGRVSRQIARWNAQVAEWRA